MPGRVGFGLFLHSKAVIRSLGFLFWDAGKSRSPRGTFHLWPVPARLIMGAEIMFLRLITGEPVRSMSPAASILGRGMVERSNSPELGVSTSSSLRKWLDSTRISWHTSAKSLDRPRLGRGFAIRCFVWRKPWAILGAAWRHPQSGNRAFQHRRW